MFFSYLLNNIPNIFVVWAKQHARRQKKNLWKQTKQNYEEARTHLVPELLLSQFVTNFPNYSYFFLVLFIYLRFFEDFCRQTYHFYGFLQFWSTYIWQGKNTHLVPELRLSQFVPNFPNFTIFLPIIFFAARHLLVSFNSERVCWIAKAGRL